MAPVLDGVQPDVAGVAVEGQRRDWRRRRGRSCAPARGRSAVRCPCPRACGPAASPKFPAVAGVDADHLMRAQGCRAPAPPAASPWCRDPARGRSRSAPALPALSMTSPIRTRSPRHLHVGAQHGRGDRRRSRVLRASAVARDGREQGGGEEERAGDHGHVPQRNMLAVDCIIWSAALTTLAFIS